MVSINLALAITLSCMVSLTYGQRSPSCSLNNPACKVNAKPKGGKYGTGELGRGYTYYGYFAERPNTYCPKYGSYAYADCRAASEEDIAEEDCTACCSVCCDARPATTCTPADASCSKRSVIANGNTYKLDAGHGQGSGTGGFTYYEYFQTSHQTYCPVTGSRNYADCAAACRGDVHFEECIRCCNSCCSPGQKKTRLIDILAQELRELSYRDDDYDEMKK